MRILKEIMSLKEQSQDAVKQEIPRLIQRYCERLSYGIIIVTQLDNSPRKRANSIILEVKTVFFFFFVPAKNSAVDIKHIIDLLTYQALSLK